MKNFFTTGHNNIAYLGDNFKQHFSDMEVKIPKTLKLELNERVQELEKDMKKLKSIIKIYG